MSDGVSSAPIGSQRASQCLFSFCIVLPLLPASQLVPLHASAAAASAAVPFFNCSAQHVGPSASPCGPCDWEVGTGTCRIGRCRSSSGQTSRAAPTPAPTPRQASGTDTSAAAPAATPSCGRRDDLASATPARRRRRASASGGRRTPALVYGVGPFGAVPSAHATTSREAPDGTCGWPCV